MWGGGRQIIDQYKRINIKPPRLATWPSISSNGESLYMPINISRIEYAFNFAYTKNMHNEKSY